MALSPRDISAKTFKKGLWGYKREEVDFFLKQLAQGVDDLRREMDHIRLELAESEKRIGKYREDNESVKETLELAREKAELIVAKGRQTAKSMVERAEEEAQSIMEGYQREIMRRKSILYEITDIAKGYRKKFERMIQHSLRNMDDFEESMESRKAEKVTSSIAKDERIEDPVAESEWAKATTNFRIRSQE